MASFSNASNEPAVKLLEPASNKISGNSKKDCLLLEEVEVGFAGVFSTHLLLFAHLVASASFSF